MRARTAAIRSVLIVFTLTIPAACQEGADCASTAMEAQPARLGVLDARLTASGVGVPGVDVDLAVFADGETVHRAEATTDGQGRVRYDVKGALDAVALARGDEWQASFDGNAAFCSSADDAPFGLVG